MNFEKHCKKCRKGEHCCIFEDDSGFVFVGIKDAKNIKKKTNQDYSYFLDYSPSPKKMVYSLKTDDPSLEGRLRYKQLDKKNRLLKLKTQKEGRCIFLNDSNLCDIYEVRPNICKIFPFWAMKLNNGKTKIISHGIDPGCGIIRALYKQFPDIEQVLDKSEIKKIKKVFSAIKREHIYYKKNIKNFLKNHNPV